MRAMVLLSSPILPGLSGAPPAEVRARSRISSLRNFSSSSIRSSGRMSLISLFLRIAITYPPYGHAPLDANSSDLHVYVVFVKMDRITGRMSTVE